MIIGSSTLRIQRLNEGTGRVKAAQKEGVHDVTRRVAAE